MEEKEKARNAMEALEDLIESEAEWRDVPSIIRLAFRATYALAKHSMAVNDALENELLAKADKEDMKKAFKFKANIVDVEESLEKVAEELERKVSVEELDGVLNEFVRRDESMQGGIAGGGSPELEERIQKLEDVAYALEAEDSRNMAKNFATRAELKMVEQMVNECCKADELKVIKNQIVSKAELDEIISNQLVPDIAEQMKEIQQDTKAKLNQMIEDLESRVNNDDFSVIRADIERLLRDKDVAGNQLKMNSIIQEISEKQSLLEHQMKNVVKLPEEILMIKNDLKNAATVSRGIQEDLEKIVVDVQNLPVTTRVKEIDLYINSAMDGISNKLKRLESSDKRTQEILEILSKSKLKDERLLEEEDPYTSNRSRSLLGRVGLDNQPLIEQINEIKSYVDKKLRKIEAVYASREDLDKLEDRFDESETTHNQMIDTLKELVSELSSQFKINCKELEDKFEKKLKKSSQGQNKGAGKSSVLANLDDSSKLDMNSKSQASADKLKNLDGLIQRVSGLVEKKARDEEWKVDLVRRVETLETKLEEKADKSKVCKLLDRKAGRRLSSQTFRISTKL